MADTPKRFEDWEEVDCNECEHWWTNRCDGASKGSKVGCNSFLATRSVVIPARLNDLENRVRCIAWCGAGLGICILLHVLLSHVWGL